MTTDVGFYISYNMFSCTHLFLDMLVKWGMW